MQREDEPLRPAADEATDERMRCQRKRAAGADPRRDGRPFLKT